MKNAAKKEFIGLSVIVVDSANKNDIGLNGTIVDETQSTFIIKAGKGKKTLMKRNIELEIPKFGIRIKGRLLVGRPEDRIKKK